MTMNVLYDGSTVEIEGTSQTLRGLAQQIEDCTGVCHIQATMASGGNDRGLRHANAITVRVNSGPVNISSFEEGILISGSRAKLLVLAQNIRWLADKPEGGAPTELKDHIHIEYHPDHFFLAEGALPMVLTKTDCDLDTAAAGERPRSDILK
jgi:hypothetical protein